MIKFTMLVSELILKFHSMVAIVYGDSLFRTPKITLNALSVVFAFSSKLLSHRSLASRLFKNFAGKSFKVKTKPFRPRHPRRPTHLFFQTLEVGRDSFVLTAANFGRGFRRSVSLDEHYQKVFHYLIIIADCIFYNVHLISKLMGATLEHS